MENKEKVQDKEKSKDFWREHVAQADRFPGTQNEYCRQHDISKSKLSYYKLKFAEQSKFAKVKSPSIATNAPQPNRPLVRVKSQIDPAWLGEFLRELLK